MSLGRRVYCFGFAVVAARSQYPSSDASGSSAARSRRLHSMLELYLVRGNPLSGRPASAIKHPGPLAVSASGIDNCSF